ncbi:DUF3515 domain-containing protein [Actinoplanes sp. GCM10030250]|uniref:DUF3515 domain-containing protein n=1 Tax=Actinoplanes sp. GCM10030250 TaxID=3273376 RepID=UPI00361EA580
MVDVDIPRTTPEPPEPDRTTRVAALWATAVAVPVALLVGVFAFMAIQPEKSDVSDKSLKQPVVVPSTEVRLDAPRLDDRAALACLAVTSQLPAKVRDLQQRRVSAGPEQNAAYGEPPLAVQCGVPQPIMCQTPKDETPGCIPMDTELLIMNQVCWYAKADTGAATFTTMDREVPVRVTVPDVYENPAQWANEFSDTVVKTVKSTPADKQPYGCNN